MRELYSKWKELKWYVQILILSALIGLLYYVLKEYYFLVIVVGGALITQAIWRAIFCRAKNKNNYVEFNLSIFAEFILMLWYLAFLGIVCYGLFTESISWYGYIIPGVFLLVNIGKVFQIFGNRRDFIRISEQTLSWKNGDESGEIEFKNYFFENRETQALEFRLSLAALGPFLIVTDSENKEHSFDLKTMNLGGHNKVLESYFQTHFSDIKKK